jgi:hypothetical protein
MISAAVSAWTVTKLQNSHAQPRIYIPTLCLHLGLLPRL